MAEDKEALREHLKIPKAWRLRESVFYGPGEWEVHLPGNLDRPEGWIVGIEVDLETFEDSEQFDVNKFKLYYEKLEQEDLLVYPSDWKKAGENWKKVKGEVSATENEKKILEWDLKNRIKLFEEEAKATVEEETKGTVGEEEDGEGDGDGVEKDYPYNLSEEEREVEDDTGKLNVWKISKEGGDKGFVYYFKKNGEFKRYYEDSTNDQAPNKVIEAFNPPEAWEWEVNDNEKFLYNTKSKKTMWSINKRKEQDNVFNDEDGPTEADIKAEEVANKKENQKGGRKSKRKRKSKRRKSKRRTKRRKSKRKMKRRKSKRRVKRRKSKRKMKRRKSKRRC